MHKSYLLFLTINGRTIRIKLTNFQQFPGYFPPPAACKQRHGREECGVVVTSLPHLPWFHPFVRSSTFYIFRYFSKSTVVNEKIVIEQGLNNCKKGNWKTKLWKRKKIFKNDEIENEIYVHHFLSIGGCHCNHAEDWWLP